MTRLNSTVFLSGVVFVAVSFSACKPKAVVTSDSASFIKTADFTIIRDDSWRAAVKIPVGGHANVDSQSVTNTPACDASQEGGKRRVIRADNAFVTKEEASSTAVNVVTLSKSTQVCLLEKNEGKTNAKIEYKIADNQYIAGWIARNLLSQTELDENVAIAKATEAAVEKTYNSLSAAVVNSIAEFKDYVKTVKEGCDADHLRILYTLEKDKLINTSLILNGVQIASNITFKNCQKICYFAKSADGKTVQFGTKSFLNRPGENLHLEVPGTFVNGVEAIEKLQARGLCQ